jgi:hypothetical protein
MNAPNMMWDSIGQLASSSLSKDPMSFIASVDIAPVAFR